MHDDAITGYFAFSAAAAFNAKAPRRFAAGFAEDSARASISPAVLDASWRRPVAIGRQGNFATFYHYVYRLDCSTSSYALGHGRNYPSLYFFSAGE